jgi:hypothetical protein
MVIKQLNPDKPVTSINLNKHLIKLIATVVAVCAVHEIKATIMYKFHTFPAFYQFKMHAQQLTAFKCCGCNNKKLHLIYCFFYVDFVLYFFGTVYKNIATH